MKKSDIIKYSGHAKDKISSRSKNRPGYFSKCIYTDKYVLIGHEPDKPHKHHYLIYSDLDDQWFVIIIDTKYNYIITCLYLDFHENISWNVSQESMDIAKELILRKSSVSPNDSRRSKRKVFTIKFSLFKNNKIKLFLKYPLSDDINTIDKVLVDEAFLASFRNQLKETPYDIEDIMDILIRVGGSGPYTYVTEQLIEQFI